MIEERTSTTAACLLQDALGVTAFSSSEEAFVAEALFEAYRSQDAEAVKSVVKAKHILSDLDNAVSTPCILYAYVLSVCCIMIRSIATCNPLFGTIPVTLLLSKYAGVSGRILKMERYMERWDVDGQHAFG